MRRAGSLDGWTNLVRGRSFGVGRWLRGGIIAGLASGAFAVEPSPVVRLDVGEASGTDPVVARATGDAWAMDINARYDRHTQVLRVSGTYWTTVRFDAESRLSYQLYGAEGELIEWDGPRFAWERSDRTGGRQAEFEAELPLLARAPDLQALRLQFNAVVEGRHWYSEARPEVEFPAVELVNLPRRDHYLAGRAWMPAWLPAQTRCRVPVWWHVAYRDEDYSGYQASMQAVDPAGLKPVDSDRVALPAEGAGRRRMMAWLPLREMPPGVMNVRPGLVWEGLRWYESDGWFAYQTVRFVPPLLYLTGLMAAGALLGAGWRGSGRWRRLALRVPVRLAVGWGAAWVVAQLIVSGYWIAGLLLALVAAQRSSVAGLAGGRAYRITWLILAFIELYWGWMSGGAAVHPGATIFSLAVWALLLLPVLVLRPRWLRHLVCGVLVCGWLAVSTGAVIYNRFFQDFPSVDSLTYAGQVAHLGDSILTLIEQRHLVPWLVALAAAGIALWPRRSVDADQEPSAAGTKRRAVALMQ